MAHAYTKDFCYRGQVLQSNFISLFILSIVVAAAADAVTRIVSFMLFLFAMHFIQHSIIQALSLVCVCARVCVH